MGYYIEKVSLERAEKIVEYANRLDSIRFSQTNLKDSVFQAKINHVITLMHSINSMIKNLDFINESFKNSPDKSIKKIAEKERRSVLLSIINNSCCNAKSYLFLAEISHSVRLINAFKTQPNFMSWVVNEAVNGDFKYENPAFINWDSCYPTEAVDYLLEELRIFLLYFSSFDIKSKFTKRVVKDAN